jgi:amino acid transporter
MSITMKNVNEKHKLGMIALVTMIFTSVYGFTNAGRAFLLMGYSAIPWYILAGIAFSLPFAFMLAEFGSAFKESKGGMYSWIAPVMGERFAFTGIFMWYAGYLFWMLVVASSIWVPLANFVHGYDSTKEWMWGNLEYSQILGIMGILWMLFIAFVSTHGLKSISLFGRIGGMAVWTLNLILIVLALIILIINRGQVAFQMTGINGISVFFHSPNPSYQDWVQKASFLVFAVFAFGGMETIAGLVDKVRNPLHTFPRGLLISAVLIVIGYSVCIFAIGIFTDWDKLANDPSVNLINVIYAIMYQLGHNAASLMGLSEAISVQIGFLFSRLTGAGMFLSLTGAFFTLAYAPLKQLIEGTPAHLWPAFMLKKRNDIPVNAIYVQTVVVIVMIALRAFGGQGAKEFFNQLINSTNVALTLPYVFISLSFFFFRKNDSIAKPFVVFRTKFQALMATIIVSGLLVFANFFAIFGPVMQTNTAAARNETLVYLAGPAVFGAIALIIYERGRRSQSSNKAN